MRDNNGSERPRRTPCVPLAAAAPPLAMAVAAAALLGGGCAWHEPSRVEEDFGNSVRQMVQEQIYDPRAASEPAAGGPDLLDGTTADIVVDGYRGAAGEARTFRQQTPNNPVPVTARGRGADSESTE